MQGSFGSPTFQCVRIPAGRISPDRRTSLSVTGPTAIRVPGSTERTVHTEPI